MERSECKDARHTAIGGMRTGRSSLLLEWWMWFAPSGPGAFVVVETGIGAAARGAPQGLSVWPGMM